MKKIIISILLALVGAVLIGCLAIIILMLVIPSRDEEGHATMPIFQFLIGWLIGIIAFFVIFILTFRKIHHREFPLNIGNRPILPLYFIFCLLFCFGVIISFYGYSYSGYYTDKIINWIWLSLTVIIIVLFWGKRPVRIYFYSLLTLVVLSIVPMAIPFFGIVYYFSTIDDFQQITINKDYRLERTRPNAMANETIIIYENRGLLEKKIVYDVCNQCLDMYNSAEENLALKNNNIDDVQLVKITKDSIATKFIIKNKEIKNTFPIIK